MEMTAAAAVLLFPMLCLTGENMEELTAAKILGTGPEWQRKYDQYQPPQDMLDALSSKLGGNMKIDVYLGLWCPDSRDNLPPFIKVMDRLAGKIPVRYFGVPRKAGKDTKFYVEVLKVERVPTFIFYRDGKEIGRIIENPKAGMLEDFMDIVFRGN